MLVEIKSGYLVKRPTGKTTGAPLGAAKRRYIILYSSQIVWFKFASDARASLSKRRGALPLNGISTTVTLSKGKLTIKTPGANGKAAELVLTSPESELPGWLSAVEDALGKLRDTRGLPCSGDESLGEAATHSASSSSIVSGTRPVAIRGLRDDDGTATLATGTKKRVQMAPGTMDNTYLGTMDDEFEEHKRKVEEHKRGRATSSLHAHTFDLVIVSPYDEDLGQCLDEEDDETGGSPPKPHDVALFSRLRCDRQAGDNWKRDAMRAGRYIERRAREIGFVVEMMYSRDADEEVRRVWAPPSKLRQYADARRRATDESESIAGLLPSERDAEKPGNEVAAEYTSLERIYLMRELLAASSDTLTADDRFKRQLCSGNAPLTSSLSSGVPLPTHAASLGSSTMDREDAVQGGDLPLDEYAEKDMLMYFGMHDGPARDELWDLYWRVCTCAHTAWACSNPRAHVISRTVSTAMRRVSSWQAELPTC